MRKFLMLVGLILIFYGAYDAFKNRNEEIRNERERFESSVNLHIGDIVKFKTNPNIIGIVMSVDLPYFYIRYTSKEPTKYTFETERFKYFEVEKVE